MDGVTFKYDSKLIGAYGVTPTVGADLVEDIGPALFTSPYLLKATMVHEYGHAIQDKIKTASGGFSKWTYAPGAFPAIDATLAADGPLGYAHEIYSAGRRMKIVL